MIASSPTERDPRRHLLFVHGDLLGIQSLVRKLGARCGRPQKVNSEEYNFTLSLKVFSKAALKRIEEDIQSAAPQAARAFLSGRPRQLEPEPAPPPPRVEPLEVPPPPPSTAEEPAPGGISEALPTTPGAESEASARTLAPRSGGTSVPEAEQRGAAPLDVEPVPESPEALAPLPEPAPAEPTLEPLVPAPPVEAGPPVPFASAPPAAAPLDVSGASVPAVLKPAPDAGPAALGNVSRGQAPERPRDQPVLGIFPGQAGPEDIIGAERAFSEKFNRPLWGALQEVPQEESFENLLVGAYNRFAHAASMSVVGSPGSMYNPLFLFGGPGTGKTHLLRAIAHGLKTQAGLEPLFFTSGVHLSYAVSAASRAGKLKELEEAAAKTRALVVDDFHLMALSDSNAQALASFFNLYLGSSKQVVLSSAYPPSSLLALEEGLKFHIGQGWSVDLKLPGAEIQREILAGALGRAGYEAEEEALRLFYDRLASNFPQLRQWMVRLKALGRLRSAAPKGAKGLPELSDELFQFDLVEEGKEVVEIGELTEASRFTPPAPREGARRLGVFHPKGKGGEGGFVLWRFFKDSGDKGFSWNLSAALKREYDPEGVAGLPFILGNLALEDQADGVLLVGPPPGSKLAEHEGDFAHAAAHVFGPLGVGLGWIPFQGIKSKAGFFQAALDLRAAGLT